MTFLNLLRKKETLPGLGEATVGLVAGWGELALEVAKVIRRKGYKLSVISLERGEDESLSEIAEHFHATTLDRGLEILDFLKKNEIRHLVLAGKVPKKRLHQNGFQPDAMTQEILQNAGDRKGDDRLLKAVWAALKINGISVIPLQSVLEDDLTPKAILTRRKPTPKEKRDLEFGYEIAKTMGRLDIGQTVVVKDGAVIAVEAMEGTDETLRRVKELNIPGNIVVKAAKPQQDLRFDLPVIGMNTLESAHQAGCSVLAVEKGKSLIFNRREVVDKADEYQMTIIGI